jgi:outer membrane immunogenic protein
MRTIFVTAAALVIISGSASADGVYQNHYSAPLLYSWSGSYVGLNVGFAWGTSNATTTTGCPGEAPPGYVCELNTPGSLANAPVVDGAGSGSMNLSGAIGGIEVGHNWQVNNFVYGVEADFGALNMSASRSGSGTWPFLNGAAPFAFTVGSSISTNWLLTTRARVGWTFSNVLLYATGGLALTDLKVSNFYTDGLTVLGVGTGHEFSSDSAVTPGWTVGGGLEAALDEHWSLKGEYLFVDFGHASTTGNITNPEDPGFLNPISASQDLSAHLARVGLNYRY